MFETILSIAYGNVLIGCSNGRCRIVIVLVIIGFVQNAVVNYVQTVAAAGEGKAQRKDGKGCIYLFHIYLY